MPRNIEKKITDHALNPEQHGSSGIFLCALHLIRCTAGQLNFLCSFDQRIWMGQRYNWASLELVQRWEFSRGRSVRGDGSACGARGVGVS
jgi:hypothetical protein